MAYEERAAAAQSAKRPNNLTLEARRHLTVSGVEEVVSFDESEIRMRTGDGDLVVRGGEMNISKLNTDNGDVHIQGRISELCYEEAVPERSLWARLFH